MTATQKINNNFNINNFLKIMHLYIGFTAWLQLLQCVCVHEKLPIHLFHTKMTRISNDERSLTSLSATTYQRAEQQNIGIGSSIRPRRSHAESERWTKGRETQTAWRPYRADWWTNKKIAMLIVKRLTHIRWLQPGYFTHAMENLQGFESAGNRLYPFKQTLFLWVRTIRNIQSHGRFLSFF